MFALASLFTLVLASVGSAAPIPMKRSSVAPRDSTPSGWAIEYLESYSVYHARYDSFGCKTQHGTTFFDECCHPLLNTESVSILPSTCVASSSSLVSSAAASATGDDDDCPAETSTSAAATSTVSVGVQAGVISSTSTQAPATSTQAPVTSTEPAATTSSAAPAATTSSSSSSNTYTGHATYFYQDNTAGACGNVNSDSTHVVALPYALYGNDGSSPSDYCGKTITITRTSNGAQTTAVVADLCPTCTTTYSIDLSVGAFTSIATEDEGQVDVTYQFD